MGTDYFASGVFGIRLDDYDECGDLIKRLNLAMDGLADEDDAYTPINTAFLDEAIKIFKDIGIELPADVGLHYTENEDNHAGRSFPPPESWLIGYGILTKPWEYPTDQFSAAFKEEAAYYTWVTWG